MSQHPLSLSRRLNIVPHVSRGLTMVLSICGRGGFHNIHMGRASKSANKAWAVCHTVVSPYLDRQGKPSLQQTGAPKHPADCTFPMALFALMND